MGWVETNRAGLTFFQCRELNDGQVIQGVSAKNCGNLALHTGDDPNCVIERRKSWLQVLGLDLNHVVSGVQVHGTKVALVDKTTAGSGAFSIEEAIRETDALITKETDLILATFTADCLPIFVYDPITPAIGVIHAGWRGTINGIVSFTIKRMVEEFGVCPGNCLAAIGPSICSDCFQVDRQLAEGFRKVYPQTVSENESGYRVDLQTFIRLDLIRIGIKPDRIYDARLCTSCRPELFFSYRAERGTTGRMMGIIGLKDRAGAR